MNIKTLALVLLALPAMSAPAAAVPFCTGGTGVTSDFNTSFGIRIGRYTEEERGELARQQLRQRGVDATRVEFWNGCLRAYVRQPGGGEAMEFYDPTTFRQVF